MNRFLTLLLAASCLTAVGQVPDYVPTDGLVAWWAFNGSVDESLIGLTSGSQVTFGEDRFGVENRALDMFNSPAPYIDYGGEISELGQLQSITISLWSKLEDASAYNHFIQHRTSDVNFNFVVSNNNTGFYAYHGTSNDSLLQTSTLPTTDQWFMLTWTLECNSDSVRSSMFLNGVSIGQKSFGSGCLYSLPTDVLNVGGGAANLENKVKGSIDDLGIWERALSEEEIFEFYSTAKPVAGCLDELACNFNSDAQLDDGSCHFLCDYCKEGTVWDEAVQGCIVANPSDSNFDGCVQLNDLLDLLSAYGDCGAEESAWQCGEDLEYGGDNYGTIQVGEQCWFSENLRSNYYSDGSLVESIQNNSNWANGNVGMICTYGNVASNEDLYGSLYNWHAVADVRGLCPTGWHVAEQVEWEDLLGSAGGAAVAGQTLKAQDFWADGAQGNDALGFDGRPGGYRRYDGTYQTLGSKGYWWTSTAVNDGQATIFELNSSAAVVTYPDLINGGFSVRCLKNAE